MAIKPRFILSGAGRLDPLRGYKFNVSTETESSSAGGLLCGFNKVSGLSDESEIAEYRDGCDPVTMRKFPGIVSFENVTLERGLSINDDLLAWRELVVDSDITQTAIDNVDGVIEGFPLGSDGFRRTLNIELYDRGSSVIQRAWSLREAWPCKLDDGELDSSSSDVVIESAEFCHEGLIRRFGDGGAMPGTSESSKRR